MPLSFDPDFQASGPVRANHLDCTLPSGVGGDLLVAYVFTSEGSGPGPFGAVSSPATWSLKAHDDTGGSEVFAVWTKTREDGETIATFVTWDYEPKYLAAIVLNIPASVADQIDEIQGAGAFITVDADLPESTEYADVIKFLTGATALPWYATGKTVNVTLDSAGEYGELEHAFELEEDEVVHRVMIDAWVYEPGIANPSLTLSSPDSPVADMISVWVRDVAAFGYVPSASEGWVTGRVAFG